MSILVEQTMKLTCETIIPTNLEETMGVKAKQSKLIRRVEELRQCGWKLLTVEQTTTGIWLQTVYTLGKIYEE